MPIFKRFRKLVVPSPLNIFVIFVLNSVHTFYRNALVDCGLTSAQLAKTQDRVRELCAEIKSQGKAQHLDLDNITVSRL